MKMISKDLEDGTETIDGRSFIPADVVERAVRLSYLQTILSAVYIASTGGMFLIGYALKLGANNVQIGLMSSIPMLFVVVQLVSAAVVERGVSRRKLTVVASLLSVLGWLFIIVLPYVSSYLSLLARIYILIAIISISAGFAHIANNARASWIGDLIPAKKRGDFFGKVFMYAGLIGTILAVVEGLILDHIKRQGISGFTWLFLFGMAFGLVSTLLFIPQPDVPIATNGSGVRFRTMVRQTFANKALMGVMVYAIVWSLQTIAAPFYTTYMLRDLKMPFVGIGIINAIPTITMLLSSPFWGRMVDKYGCRPVILACTMWFVPWAPVWYWLDSPVAIYAVIGPLNFLGGFAVAGVSVALNTLIYKVTPASGRSVQLAIYTIIAVLVAAPMPALGGHLPDWLRSVGIQADLRVTFYATMPVFVAAVWAARRIKEPDSSRTGKLIRSIPGHLKNPETLQLSDQA
ncbi:MAG: MFS transporter [Armatimonadetes bacterium]|nr:MFS transporter [Armatimonadota bacterium]